ncbi:MAG: L-threonylcarbamoyladenylate synthase [Bacteroidota bacterium]
MIGNDLKKAVKLLKNNDLVAIPTETVYGLAANALSTEAIVKIFEVKNRPFFDPLIIHIDHFKKMEIYARNIPEKILFLAASLSPGPITFLLERKAIIPDLITAGSPLVAIRIPNHPLTLDLLSNLPFPLAAPSANPFGYISPTSAQHVAQQLGEEIPYILDGGTCSVGVESTIIGYENNQATIYRKGGISIEKIESLIGSVQVKEHSTSNPKSPGQLKSHYAPRVPFKLGDLPSLIDAHQGERLAVLSFDKAIKHASIQKQLVLSPKSSLSEAAQNLFAYMRLLDQEDVDVILAEKVPNMELGKAINDRLMRAAADYI